MPERLRPSTGRSRNSVLDTQRRVAEAARELDVSLRRTNWVWPVAAALILIVIAGAVILYAYRWGTGTVDQGDLPIVQAQSEPIKVKPDSPGGLEVPYQDISVLNQDGGEATAGVEQLLPPPEVPQPPPAEPAPYQPAPETGEAAGAMIGAVPPAPEAPALPEAPETTIPAAPETQLPEAPQAEAPAPEGGTGDSGAADLPPPPPPKPVRISDPQASQVAAIPAPQAGDHLLQLGAFADQEAVRAAWAGLKTKFPDLLGSMASTVQEAKVGGKTYYRLQTGPFPNRATALDFCAQLKAGNQDCLVVQR